MSFLHFTNESILSPRDDLNRPPRREPPRRRWEGACGNLPRLPASEGNVHQGPRPSTHRPPTQPLPVGPALHGPRLPSRLDSPHPSESNLGH